MPWSGEKRGLLLCLDRRREVNVGVILFAIRIEASEIDGGERRRVASKRWSRDEVLKTYYTKYANTAVKHIL